MTAKKWHIGDVGVALCKAEIQDCRFGVHSESETEMQGIYESQLEALYGDPLASQGRPSEDPRERLKDEALYLPQRPRVSYSEEDRSVAATLAQSEFSELSGMVATVDEDWSSEGSTGVKRVILEDGSAGYFKGIVDNSKLEGRMRAYGHSSLSTAVADVNAYMVARALGPEYSQLVPETTLREIDGQLGSIQREVKPKEMDGDPNELVPLAGTDGSYFRGFVDAAENHLDGTRKAAIYDFVIGNCDRNENNFILSAEGGAGGVNLIDNSYSFPDNTREKMAQKSYFTGAFVFNRIEDARLTEDEKSSLSNARREVESWISKGTISGDRGRAVQQRIDYLLEKGELMSFSKYQNTVVDKEIRRQKKLARAAKLSAQG